VVASFFFIKLTSSSTTAERPMTHALLRFAKLAELHFQLAIAMLNLETVSCLNTVLRHILDVVVLWIGVLVLVLWVGVSVFVLVLTSLHQLRQFN